MQRRQAWVGIKTVVRERRPARAQWTVAEAQAWYASQPWLVGCNFIPSTAVNQLEMWQADTFDLEAIDRELGWASQIGFNTARVFLHDLLWKQDPDGLTQRVDLLLATASRHGICPMLVLLDGVWDPSPRIGRQRAPRAHVHNSGWVQSPGVEILSDPARHDELEGYVKGVIGHFREDARVLAWDLFNEPDNPNPIYAAQELPNKAEVALMLLRRAYEWAREAGPTQPITAGVWRGHWGDIGEVSEIDRLMLTESDVISFHSYDPADRLRVSIDELRQYSRPMLLTEYFSRPTGSTFEATLPMLKERKVGAYNWGFVAGKTQTIYPWDSWARTYTSEPEVWFHDVLRPNGTPYRQEEVDLIRRLSGVS